MAAAVAGGTPKPPPAGAFFAPAGLSDHTLLKILVAVSGDVVASFPQKVRPHYQRRNTGALLRRIQILAALFDGIRDSLLSRSTLPQLVIFCLKEFYIVVHRARILLDYCLQSSRMWLILRNRQIADQFRDLDCEISTLLDVFPLRELGLAADVREHVELLRWQGGRSRLYVDQRDEELRIQILSFLNDFEQGRLPDPADLRSVFADLMGIMEVRDFESEIEFLEEQIVVHEDDSEVVPTMIGGAIALARYCRFLLFRTEEAGSESGKGRKRTRKGLSGGSGVGFSLPKDFCCSISLELMRDPVVVSTGQTYDRESIVQWLERGHRTCPNSGQTLGSAGLVPNRSLRIFISKWCAANSIPYDLPGIVGHPSVAASAASTAAFEANRATTRILIRHLSAGEDDSSKAIAARELRLLAKIGKENRAVIAEEGAIPLLCRLLQSPDRIAQENAITAILNISIHDGNKIRIMEQEGCLHSIVRVLRLGLTPEARENAAAALFSLSAVHEYKKRIVDEAGGVEALAALLRKGSARGKKDAVMAMYNLATHPESWERMASSGAVAALVGALGNQGVAEESAGALALLARQPVVAGMVGWEEKAVAGLAAVMRAGSSRGRENAAAALHEVCWRGGAAVAERVARVPGVAVVVQTLALAGTKRARRKAAALARMLQRREPMPAPAPAPSPPAIVMVRDGWQLGRNGEMSPVSVAVPVP